MFQPKSPIIKTLKASSPKSTLSLYSDIMGDPNFYIETPRLILSHPNASLDSHCDFLIELNNCPAVIKGNARHGPDLSDRAAARKNIELNNEQMLSKGYGRYLISIKPSSSEATNTDTIPENLESYTKIGHISMKKRPGPGAPTLPDIGFAILTQFEGKGYATEAARAVIKYFQEVRKETKFLGYCDPLNGSSMGMFKRLGWENRGLKGVRGFMKDGSIIRVNLWSFGVSGDVEEYNVVS